MVLSNPSVPLFRQQEKLLNIIVNNELLELSDFVEICGKIRARAPHIHIFLGSPTGTAEQVSQNLWALPALTIGVGTPVGSFTPKRGDLIYNKAVSKLDQAAILQKLFPGYMMIRMRLTDETWYVVLGTSGVGDFTGAGGKPMPMPESEVNRLLNQETVTEEVVEGEQPATTVKGKESTPLIRFSVSVGEGVKVKEGPFENFEGQVHSLDDHTGKIKVMIEIFGRSTEVELEHWQVEKV